MAKGYLIDAELLKAIRAVVHEVNGQLKNPGGVTKRGNVSIGLSSYVAKIKTTVTARSGTTLGEGEVYLCETDSDGILTATTITKTAYNEGGREIALSTEQDTYVRIQQTNWGQYVVSPPNSSVNKCLAFDGVQFSDISGFVSTDTQFLTHIAGTSTGTCLAWVTGSTCT